MAASRQTQQITHGFAGPGLYYFNKDTPGFGILVTDANFPQFQKHIRDFRYDEINRYQEGMRRSRCCGIVKADGKAQFDAYATLVQVANDPSILFDVRRVAKAAEQGTLVRELELEEDLNTFVTFLFRNLHASNSKAFAAYLGKDNLPTDAFFKAFKMSPVGQIALMDATKSGPALDSWNALKKAVAEARDKRLASAGHQQTIVQRALRRRRGMRRKRVEEKQAASRMAVNLPSSQQLVNNANAKLVPLVSPETTYKVPVFSSSASVRVVLKCTRNKDGSTTLVTNDIHGVTVYDADRVVYCGYVNKTYVVCYKTIKNSYKLVTLFTNHNPGFDVLSEFKDVIAFTFNTDTMALLAFMDVKFVVHVYDYLNGKINDIKFTQPARPSVFAVSLLGIATSDQVYYVSTQQTSQFTDQIPRRAIAWCANDPKEQRIAAIGEDGRLKIEGKDGTSFGDVDVEFAFGAPNDFSELWWWKESVKLSDRERPCHIFAMKTKSTLLVMDAANDQSIWYGDAPHPVVYYTGAGNLTDADCHQVTSNLNYTRASVVAEERAMEIELTDEDNDSLNGSGSDNDTEMAHPASRSPSPQPATSYGRLPAKSQRAISPSPGRK